MIISMGTHEDTKAIKHNVSYVYWLPKGVRNACVSLRISRVPRQQEIHLFASYNPSFFQPIDMHVNVTN